MPSLFLAVIRASARALAGRSLREARLDLAMITYLSIVLSPFFCQLCHQGQRMARRLAHAVALAHHLDMCPPAPAPAAVYPRSAVRIACCRASRKIDNGGCLHITAGQRFLSRVRPARDQWKVRVVSQARGWRQTVVGIRSGHTTGAAFKSGHLQYPRQTCQS